MFDIIKSHYIYVRATSSISALLKPRSKTDTSTAASLTSVNQESGVSVNCDASLNAGSSVDNNVRKETTTDEVRKETCRLCRWCGKQPYRNFAKANREFLNICKDCQPVKCEKCNGSFTYGKAGIRIPSSMRRPQKFDCGRCLQCRFCKEYKEYSEAHFFTRSQGRLTNVCLDCIRRTCDTCGKAFEHDPGKLRKKSRMDLGSRDNYWQERLSLWLH